MDMKITFLGSVAQWRVLAQHTQRPSFKLMYKGGGGGRGGEKEEGEGKKGIPASLWASTYIALSLALLL